MLNHSNSASSKLLNVPAKIFQIKYSRRCFLKNAKSISDSFQKTDALETEMSTLRKKILVNVRDIFLIFETFS